MFSSISLEQGSYSRRLGGNTVQPSYTNGGVRISLLDNTFTENGVDKNIDMLEVDPYAEVEGSFTIKFIGPTSSGVAYFAREIDNILKKAEDVYQNRRGLPVKLSFGSTDTAVLTSAKTTFKDVILNESTYYLSMDVEYKRLPIVGEPTDVDLTLIGTSNTSIDSPYRLTRDAGSYRASIPAPANLQLKLFNQHFTFPSGILLTANQPIISLSGNAFYEPTLAANNPPTITVINENRLFAYSNSVSATTGVLRYVPTSTSVVTTSGIIYGNGLSTFTTPPYTKDVDVYAVYRTTVSGTLFNLSVSAFDIINGANYTTPYKQLTHSVNPTIAYLGTVYTDDRISYNTIKMNMYPTGLISGALLIDRVILQPVDTYANRSIQVSKIDLPTFDPISFPDTPTISGNMMLTLQSNYNANTSNRLTLRPSLTVSRLTGAINIIVASKVPTYQGNISLYTKFNDFEVLDTTTVGTAMSVLFVTTGSTYDSVSGIANWTLTNRIGQKTQIAWQLGQNQEAKTIVLGY